MLEARSGRFRGGRWMMVLLLGVLVSLGTPVRAAPSIHDLDWLSGCWAATDGEPGSGEQWMPAAGGTMFGVSRTVSGGATAFFEVMQLREVDGSLEFVASPRGEGATPFRLRELQGLQVTFENPDHDFPRRVTYRRNGDLLAARIEGVSGAGEERSVDFAFERVACEELGADREAPTAPGDDSLALLFVGNSLTYTNELPGLVGALLQTAGVDSEIEAIAGPNLGLEDHFDSRRVRRRIRSGRWDFVILQQGPSATEGRPSLFEYTEKFATEIREAGAEPALYMVWPSTQRSFDFDGVSESYRLAAERNGARLARVGDAWREAWKLAPGLALYGGDGFHPSPLGSYLAALVMVETFTGIEVEDRPVDWGVDAATWEVLRRAAAAVR